MRTCNSLIIRLDAPDLPGHIHTNGDMIRGQVGLLSGSGLEIDRIAIHFKGKSTSRVVTGSGENRRVYYAKGILFNFNQDLALPTIPTSVPYSWPFEFEFPWESQFTLQSEPFEPHECFEQEPGFPLPPTFNSPMKADHSISYYLEVIANDRRAMVFHEKKNRLYITFAPSRPTLALVCPDPYSKTTALSRCTKKLDQELIAREERFSFSQRTRRLFSASEPKPTARFSIRSTIPYQGIVGGPFPIAIGITHDTTNSTAPPQVPVVTLNNIKARFTVHTYGRVPFRSFFNPNLIRNHFAHREHKAYFLERSFSLPMYDNMNLGEHLANMIIFPGLEPSFRTYNVSRRYELKITATLSCVGAMYTITLSKDAGISGFTLLPTLCKSRIDDTEERREIEERRRIAEGVQATERSLPIGDEDVEWLPTYEEVESKAVPTIPQ